MTNGAQVNQYCLNYTVVQQISVNLCNHNFCHSKPTLQNLLVLQQELKYVKYKVLTANSF